MVQTGKKKSKLKTAFKVAAVSAAILAAFHFGGKGFDPIGKVSNLFNGNAKKITQTHKKQVLKALSAEQMDEANMLFDSNVRRLATTDPKKLRVDEKIFQRDARVLFANQQELVDVTKEISDTYMYDKKKIEELKIEQKRLSYAVNKQKKDLTKRGLPSPEQLYRNVHGAVYKTVNAKDSFLSDPYLISVEKRVAEIADDPGNDIEKSLENRAEDIVDHKEEIQDMKEDLNLMDKKKLAAKSFFKTDVRDYNELHREIKAEVKKYERSLTKFGADLQQGAKIKTKTKVKPK